MNKTNNALFAFELISKTLEMLGKWVSDSQVWEQSKSIRLAMEYGEFFHEAPGGTESYIMIEVPDNLREKFIVLEKEMLEKYQIECKPYPTDSVVK